MAGDKGAIGGSKAVAGGGSSSGPPSAAAVGKEKEPRAGGGVAPDAGTGDDVEKLLGRLKLTAREAKTFVLDEAIDEAAGCPEWAIVGKVLVPNTLHIDMIKAVIQPAWGNPNGMKVHPMGPNMFLAEFGYETDMHRVLNGSPWVLGKNAILLRAFDPTVKPADIVFDRLLLWVRIYGLPYSLMNLERGSPLAGMIGEVDHLEVDANGRAWGRYLRARISVEVSEPLMRCVAVESSALKKTVFYEIKYEKLPMYCFSCGLIGHSSLLCATPATKDAEGKLPWNKDRVVVPEEGKRDPRSSSGQGSNSG